MKNKWIVASGLVIQIFLKINFAIAGTKCLLGGKGETQLFEFGPIENIANQINKDHKATTVIFENDNKNTIISNYKTSQRFVIASNSNYEIIENEDGSISVFLHSGSIESASIHSKNLKYFSECRGEIITNMACYEPVGTVYSVTKKANERIPSNQENYFSEFDEEAEEARVNSGDVQIRLRKISKSTKAPKNIKSVAEKQSLKKVEKLAADKRAVDKRADKQTYEKPVVIRAGKSARLMKKSKTRTAEINVIDPSE